MPQTMLLWRGIIGQVIPPPAEIHRRIFAGEFFIFYVRIIRDDLRVFCFLGGRMYIPLCPFCGGPTQRLHSFQYFICVGKEGCRRLLWEVLPLGEDVFLVHYTLPLSILEERK